MADPVSITASVLAIITAAIQTTNSLRDTVKRFKERNQTLKKLQNELDDLLKILASLKEAIDTDTSVLALLQGPVNRCNRLCSDFEKAMEVFSGKSKTGFRDWAKMEFMKGDINEFIEAITGYKSTISIGLGVITMHNSKVSQKVIEQYNEMIKDTSYSLEIHLQRIDEKLGELGAQNATTSDRDVDLKDEREVTRQCLRICENARSYIESLTKRETVLRVPEPETAANEPATQTPFQAQEMTSQALDENQIGLENIITRLRKRLEYLMVNGGMQDDNERSRLQEDLAISKQCLEVCQVASEVSNRKIFRVGEVVADGECDQVVVTTLADLFDVKKALSKGNSAQLVGSMEPEALRHLVENRYASRFGAVAGPDPRKASAVNTKSFNENQKSTREFSHWTAHDDQVLAARATTRVPTPNEMRKRQQAKDDVNV